MDAIRVREDFGGGEGNQQRRTAEQKNQKPTKRSRRGKCGMPLWPPDLEPPLPVGGRTEEASGAAPARRVVPRGGRPSGGGGSGRGGQARHDGEWCARDRGKSNLAMGYVEYI